MSLIRGELAGLFDGQSTVRFDPAAADDRHRLRGPGRRRPPPIPGDDLLLGLGRLHLRAGRIRQTARSSTTSRTHQATNSTTSTFSWEIGAHTYSGLRSRPDGTATWAWGTLGAPDAP